MSFSRDWASPKTTRQDHCTCEMKSPKTIEKESELTRRGAGRPLILDTSRFLPSSALLPLLLVPLRHCSLHSTWTCPARARATRESWTGAQASAPIFRGVLSLASWERSQRFGSSAAASRLCVEQSGSGEISHFCGSTSPHQLCFSLVPDSVAFRYIVLWSYRSVSPGFQDCSAHLCCSAFRRKKDEKSSPLLFAAIDSCFPQLSAANAKRRN